MIAEIHNKVSSSCSNLTERSEDALTGYFFGCMRYIPFDKGLKEVLLQCIRPSELSKYIEPLKVFEWSDKIEFWKRIKVENKSTEIDVYLDLEDILIGIEVKYLSGLSSEDDVDNSNGNNQISYNQLSREARALSQIGNNKSKLLILLADELSCTKIYQSVQMRNIINGVELGYISWQEVLMVLSNLDNLTQYEQVIINDIILLLEKKGFRRFVNFDTDVNVDKNNYWSFTGRINIKFDFKTEKKVRKGEYYEFG
ncbi:hypothetical protein SAMN02746066_04288 [Anaerosporobacter mobilis DSM 15930]|uniref:PD-(D/E)XK nuclease superfamily protein n=1 Tax=Anaerosporobacter mobilis DSM 15930 TaxID=1120996 RepID=A0A1M7N8I4_9FIRM|nr:hypothetical protein [Anaerosporobacter mobilis]SHM99882.1 hypothetical protein SAMN02746066_04288 [Anaerosporobacter mobilis DSM 15930]